MKWPAVFSLRRDGWSDGPYQRASSAEITAMKVSTMFSTNINPFVAGALIIGAHHKGPPLDEDRLTKKLSAVEPMLSPLNLRCVAREAIRITIDVALRQEPRSPHDARLQEVLRDAYRQEEEARQAAIEEPIAA